MAYLLIGIIIVAIIIFVLAVGYQAAKVWNDYDLDELEVAYLLRYFAERAPACWEGNDVDDAVDTMLRAADLLDGDR